MLKNKILLTILFSLVSFFVTSQVIIDKGTGITYTKGIPTHVPRIKADSEINIDINTGKIYRWNRPLSRWTLIAEGIDIGNFSGAPTYVPGYGQSSFVINNQKKIYYYSGGWSCLNCSLGDVLVKNGLSKTVDTIYLGGYLDRNTEIDGTGTYPFRLDSLSSFYTLVQTNAGSASQLFSLLPTSSSGINLTSTSTSNTNVNTNLNIRPGNLSQFVSRNDTLHAYLRLSPDSTIIGQGLQSGYLTSNKRIIITGDSLIFTEIDYTPTRNISRLVITSSGVVFKDSTTIDESNINEIQTLSLSNDTLSISGGNFVILPELKAGTGISILGDTIYNIGDLSNTNELQYIDSLYMSGDTLHISLSNDSIPEKFVVIPTGSSADTSGYNISMTYSGDTLYLTDGNSTLTTVIQAGISLDTSGYNLSFVRSNDTLYLTDGLNTLFVKLPADQIGTDTSGYNLSFTLSSDTLRIVDGAGELFVKLPEDQIGTDTSGYNLNLYYSGDTLYLTDGDGTLSTVIQTGVSIDTSGYNLEFSRSNDTLFIRDGLGTLLVKLPEDQIGLDTSGYNSNLTLSNDSLVLTDGLGTLSVALSQFLDNTDTSGYNLSFERSNDTLFITDANSTLFVVLPSGQVDTDDQTLSLSNDTLYISEGNNVVLTQYLDNTDTSGYNISFNRSNDTLYLVDGNSQLFVKLPTDNDIQTLTIDSVNIGDVTERFSVSILNGNTIYFDVPQISGLGGGQNNIGNNLGTGEGVYAGKTDTILNFKSIKEGTGIDLSSDASEITIKVDTSVISTINYVNIVLDSLTNYINSDLDTDSTNEIQYIDTFNIVGNQLRVSLFQDQVPFSFVDLSPYLDNTDAQTLAIDSIIVGDNERFSVSISSGNTIYFDVPQGTDTSGYNSTFFRSNDSLFIVDGNGSLFIELPEDQIGTDTSGYNISFTRSNDTLYLEDGSSTLFVTLPAEVINTDEQTLSIDSISISNGNRFSLTISNGNTIYFEDIDTDTDAQTLSLVDDVLSISNGNSVNLEGYRDSLEVYIDGDSLKITMSAPGSDTAVLFSSNSLGLSIQETPVGNTIYANFLNTTELNAVDLSNAARIELYHVPGIGVTLEGEGNLLIEESGIMGADIINISTLDSLILDSIPLTNGTDTIGFKYNLTIYDGNTVEFQTYNGNGLAHPENHNVQYYTDGLFDADTLFNYDPTNKRISVGTVTPFATGHFKTFSDVSSRIILAENTNAEDVLAVQRLGYIKLGNTEAFPRLYPIDSVGGVNLNRKGLAIEAVASGVQEPDAFLFKTNFGTTETGGPISSIRLSPEFQPSGGSVDYSAIKIDGTYSQVLGADGIIRDFYSNPEFNELSDLTNFRSFESTTDTGYAFYASGTGLSRFGGKVQLDNLDTDPVVLLGRNSLNRVTAVTLSPEFVISGDTISYLNVNLYNSNGSIPEETIRAVAIDSASTLLITYINNNPALSIYSGDKSDGDPDNGVISLFSPDLEKSIQLDNSNISIFNSTLNQIVLVDSIRYKTANSFGNPGDILHSSGLGTYWDSPIFQTLSIDSTIVGSNERFSVSISNGNTVNFDVPQNTDAQTLSLSNDTLTISGGNSVKFTNWDTDVTDDLGRINDITDTFSTSQGWMDFDGTISTDANSVTASVWDINAAFQRLGGTSGANWYVQNLTGAVNAATNKANRFYLQNLKLDSYADSISTLYGQFLELNEYSTVAQGNRAGILVSANDRSGTSDTKTIAGGSFAASHPNGGRANSCTGLSGSASNGRFVYGVTGSTTNTSGTSNQAYAFKANQTVTGSGVTANGYGLHISTFQTSGGVFQNYYGVFVQTPAATTARSFYSEGSAARMEHAGSAIFGSTGAPARTMHIAGEARITDLITDNPTVLLGADSDGDLNRVILGDNLSLSGDTLHATSGAGVTDLSFTNSSSPVTLNSSTGDDVTFEAGSNITLSQTGGTLTISASSSVSDGDKGDIDVTSSGATWTVDTSAITTVKIAADAVDSTKIGTGAVSVTDIGQHGAASGEVLKWNGTQWAPELESDTSAANEGILGVGNLGSATAILLSNTAGQLPLYIGPAFGSEISVGTSNSSNGGIIAIANTAPDQIVTLTGGGIVSISGTYPNFTITGTETANGIYGGDGTIPNGTDAALTASGTFDINYSDNGSAIAVNDALGTTTLFDGSFNSTVSVEPDQAGITSNGSTFSLNSSGGQMTADTFDVTQVDVWLGGFCNAPGTESIQSTTFTAIPYRINQVDCSGGAISVTPPSSPTVNTRFAVVDATADAATNNITINFSGSSQKLYGSIQNYIINVNGGYAEFIYMGSTTGWIATKG